MQQTPDWQFPASDGGRNEGFNDAGIETFKKHFMEKEGREAIQNALDPVKDPEKPVRVEIHVTGLAPGKIPGAQTLAATFDRCCDTIRKMAELNPGQTLDSRALSFYENAKSVLESHSWLVRISDYNTTGLVGAADGRFGSAWDNLVKGSGVNNKQGDAGGSFGIGKMASFGCSELRTVFYGTRVAGEDSYIGVTRLQSYAKKWRGNRPELTAGTGYYSQGADMLAIPGPCSLRDTPRTEDGTDLYILGAIGTPDTILDDFRRAVLMNFFITIYEGKLIVSLTDDAGTNIALTKATLGREIQMLCDRARTEKEKKPLRELQEYYDILRHEGAAVQDTYFEIPLDAGVFGKEYGFQDGECSLLLKKGEDLNRRILITRTTGMNIFEMKRFPSGLSFTGILRITGKTMNAFYREMEVPSHDDWVADTPQKKRAYTGLHNYLGHLIEERCKTAEGASVAAYGMEEFFLADDTTVKEKKAKTAAASMPQKRVSNVTVKRKPPVAHAADLEYPGETPNAAPKPDEASKSREGGTHHMHNKDWRLRTKVSMRVLPVRPMQGAYRLHFHAPTKKKDAKIELLGTPERRMNKDACGLAFAAALRDGRPLEHHGNEVLLGPVKSGEDITVDFTLALPGLFMMEANYYELK